MKYCTVPFNTLYINWAIDGKISYSLCCIHWNDCGHALTNTLNTNDIWFHENFMKLRISWITQQPIHCSKCPLFNTQDKNVFKDGTPKLSPTPERIYICNSFTCNLKCWSCRDNFIQDENDSLYKISTQKILDVFLPHAKWLSLLHSGEVFAIPFYLDMLNKIDLDKCKDLRIEIFTNGILLPNKWNSISNVHNAIEQITISIDAATKETYEKVRYPGKWEKLIEALEFVHSLISQNKIKYFQCNFVVRRSNYKEIGDFVDLCKKYGATQIRFATFGKKEHHSDEEYALEQVYNDPLYLELLNDSRLVLPGVQADIIRKNIINIEP